ncbi:hypothetical protein EsH8_V_000265 [Colletotrichum jinshuiense]
MGSKYNDARQIDGIGGGSSVTSKVAVIAPSNRPGIDVEYTFVQVAVGSETVDFSGNCGNICSGVGPFAVQERLVTPRPGARTVDVHILNTNTSKLIVETVYIDEDGDVEEDGDCIIPGVKGSGSEIKLAFVEPEGSMTGQLFPSKRLSESITVRDLATLEPFTVEATLIDAANPFVLVDYQSLPALVRSQPPDAPLSLEVAEAIRRQGAVRMGLANTIEGAALVKGTPKLAYLSRPTDAGLVKEAADIWVQAYSMGKSHPSLQLTGGVTLASAVITEGTVAHRIAGRNATLQTEGIPTPRRTPSPAEDSLMVPSKRQACDSAARDHKKGQIVRIQHSSGTMEVEVWIQGGGEGMAVDRCVVSRTARRLFEGNVLYYTREDTSSAAS